MKTRISILFIVVGLLAISCDNFLSVNSDPNNPTEVSPNLVLPVALEYTANYVQWAASPDRSLNHLGNMMMYNYGEAYGFSWYDQEFRYNVTSTFYDELFDYAYSNALKQYQILTDFSGDNSYYRAIGMIMKAYHYQILVDLYGDVPYSEALKRGQNSNPSYDEAEVIYDDLLTKLSGAISTIDSTASSDSPVKIGDDDTIFGGDMDKWKQFANTIKIRILTRLSDVKDQSFINNELAKIPNSDAYISSTVMIDPGYLVEEGKQNPFWTDLGKDVSGSETLSYQATCATQFVLDHLQGTNDPRLDAIFEEPDDGHKGINQGAPNDDENQGVDYVSNLKLNGGVLKSATMGSAIFTLAEHKLNLAELAQKGFNVGQSAQTYYEDGIEASFTYLEVASPDSSAQAYYGQATMENVSWEASTDKMDAIITQKWIATMGITAEQAWFDYNRTGYPSGEPTVSTGFPVSELAGSNDDRPMRLRYPSSEITRNTENVPEQPNAFNDAIFWAN